VIKLNDYAFLDRRRGRATLYMLASNESGELHGWDLLNLIDRAYAELPPNGGQWNASYEEVSEADAEKESEESSLPDKSKRNHKIII
jgi:hypothetical protein